MAIVKMQKFTLLALHEHKPYLLKEMQKFGDVHFKDLSRENWEDVDFLRQDFSQEQALHYEAELDKISFALKKLEPFAAKPGLLAPRPTMDFQTFDEYLLHYDYESVCDSVKKADDKIGRIKAEISRLRAENANLRSWATLDVSPGELERLETVQATIGTINKGAVDALRQQAEEQFPTLYLEVVGWIKEDAALLAICPKDCYEEAYALLKDQGYSRVALGFRELPSRLISGNNERIAELEAEEEKARGSIEARGGAYAQLQIVSDCYQTVLAREQARENFMSMDYVTLIEGWVPADETPKLQALVERICSRQCYLEFAEVKEDDEQVPIKLKNNKLVSAFTDITAMYSMPRYNEVDPTPALTPFYWLFFGLMVGDVGYGVLLLIATALVLHLVDLKDSTRNFIQFFYYLSFGVILGGQIYGSVFGMSTTLLGDVGIGAVMLALGGGVLLLKPRGGLKLFANTVFNLSIFVILGGVMYGNNVLGALFGAGTTFTPPWQSAAGAKPLLDAQEDIVVMLVLSIAIGMVHIIAGLLIKGYMGLRDRKPLDFLFDSLLWIITLLSGAGMIVGVTGLLGATVAAACKWIFFACLVGLALTQGRSSPSIGGKIGNGLYGVYGLSSYVGDLVSYTRIVALALSGAYIGFSFNLMADLMPANVFGFVCGFIIRLLGHSLNLGLALLGGYVHTCRLQYVEFFGKFYEGGGVPFAPLKIKSDNIHINM